MTAVVLIYSKTEFGHKLIESASKLKYINNNDNTICLKFPFGIQFFPNWLIKATILTLILP
jgi:hypothetical protein